MDWTRALVRDRLLSRLDNDPVRAVVEDTEARVRAGELEADEAAARIVAAVDTDRRG